MQSTNETGSPAEDVEYCRALVVAVPQLAPLLREHLEDQSGELLPYVFMDQLARWTEEHAATDPAAVRSILAYLNEGLAGGKGDIPNLILAGFVEGMSIGTELIPMVDGLLKPWVDYQFGLRVRMPPQWW